MNMAFALIAFLLVVPAALVLLAARMPSAASVRRIFATFSAETRPEGAGIAGRLRRRRLFGALGATGGLWTTAAWDSATSSWEGLLRALAGTPSTSALGTGWVTLAGPSYRLAVNVFGILVGFALGVVIAESTTRERVTSGRRTALLAPRRARRYLAPWASTAVAVSGLAAVVALPIAAAIPESRKTPTGDVASSVWWALLLLAVGALALVTRSLVVSAVPRADDVEDLVVREMTRALTAATTTIVALATFTASTASTLGRIATWFGWGWGDGTATAATVLALFALGLAVAAFATPYWILGSDVEAAADVATP